jgi:homoserine kinase
VPARPLEHLESVAAFAPATVSNVACGFDVLGFAVEGPGDEVLACRRGESGVVISALEGDGGRLPRDAGRNTAGVATRALLELVGRTGEGIDLRIHKRMPLASGLGSSAASAVAAVHAVDRLLGLGLPRVELLRCALEGERMACGSAHADNAAPCLYGGFVLVRALEPLDVVELPVPPGLSCALVRPHVEVETRMARGVLGDTVPLKAMVRQCGDLGALVAGLFRGDLALIGRALEDHVAEPLRAALVPGFRQVQAAARGAGALGCSLSGSGPSIFALCTSPVDAERVADAMAAALRELAIPADRLTSPVGAPGVR